MSQPVIVPANDPVIDPAIVPEKVPVTDPVIEDAVIEDAVAIVPVKDMQASLTLYSDVLGFERGFVSEDFSFAIIKHGAAALHLLQTSDEASLAATRNHISIYLWVKGVDELYESLSVKLSKLADGRVRAPFEQPYGMREFHVKDEDGCLLFFGENSPNEHTVINENQS